MGTQRHCGEELPRDPSVWGRGQGAHGVLPGSSLGRDLGTRRELRISLREAKAARRWRHAEVVPAYTPTHTPAELHVGHIIKRHQLAQAVREGESACVHVKHHFCTAIHTVGRIDACWQLLPLLLFGSETPVPCVKCVRRRQRQRPVSSM